MADWLQRLRCNVLTGTTYGLCIAVVFSVFVLVMLAVRGSSLLEEHDTTLATILGTYFAAGLVGGAIVGALLAIGRRWYGAMLVGYIAAIPVYGMIIMATSPPTRWMTYLPYLFYLLGPAGAVAGLWIWSEQRRQRET
jgi:hypothetical protein